MRGKKKLVRAKFYLRNKLYGRCEAAAKAKLVGTQRHRSSLIMYNNLDN